MNKKEKNNMIKEALSELKGEEKAYIKESLKDYMREIKAAKELVEQLDTQMREFLDEL